MQDSKNRIGKFETGRITLNNGDTFTLDADCQIGATTSQSASTTRNCRAT